jgi:hypothetical protein
VQISDPLTFIPIADLKIYSTENHEQKYSIQSKGLKELLDWDFLMSESDFGRIKKIQDRMISLEEIQIDQKSFAYVDNEQIGFISKAINRDVKISGFGKPKIPNSISIADFNPNKKNIGGLELLVN